MEAPQPPVRHEDNIFGICASLGQDLGFNPLYLRLVLAVSILFSPVATFATYAAMGVIVAVSRLLVPAPKRNAGDAQLA